MSEIKSYSELLKYGIIKHANFSEVHLEPCTDLGKSK